ncbi:MAG: hypothetical protein AAF610_14440 [Pseudomonadota bacterium]
MAGIALAVVAFMLIEGVGGILHPWPEDFGGTFEEIAAQVRSYPVWVLALLGGVGYGCTMFLVTFITARFSLGRNRALGLAVGALLFAMVVYNLSILPYPVWYWILMLTVLPASAYLGSRMGAQQ